MKHEIEELEKFKGSILNSVNKVTQYSPSKSLYDTSITQSKNEISLDRDEKYQQRKTLYINCFNRKCRWIFEGKA